MHETLLVIFLLISVGLIFLIILQQGKSIETGVSSGISASHALFRTSGSYNVMTRLTAILSIMFFFMSLILSNFSSNKRKQGGEWENLTQTVKSEKSTMQSVPKNPNSDIPK